MISSIETILHKSGPSLSSELTKRLVEAGLSNAAARQRISRASGVVRRLRGINFPNRESFLFIDNQFPKPEFKEKLALALEQTGSSFGRAISGLKARGGAIYAPLFPVASGLPIKKTIGHLLHSSVEKKLYELQLIEKNDTPDGPVVSLWDSSGITGRRRAVMAVEDILLSALRSWLIKIGWSSTNVLKVRGEQCVPEFGQFAWDIVGPTYLAGMITFNKGSLVNGFIVGDIIMDRTLSMDDMRPFFKKWDILQAQKRTTRFQPMIIADSFTTDSLRHLRSRGALVALPSVLFGKEVAQDLRQLMNTIENAAAAITQDPNSVFTLIERVLKVEGAALNLRGVVIEMIIAHLYKLKGYDIDIRQIVIGDEQKPAEIDVKAKNRQEVVCSECKGKAPHVFVDAPEIQDWLDKSLPRIKYWLKQYRTLPANRRFEFYSSTDYTAEAKELIKKTEALNKRQPIKFFTGNQIVEKLQEQHENTLVNIFREQFLQK